MSEQYGEPRVSGHPPEPYASEPHIPQPRPAEHVPTETHRVFGAEPIVGPPTPPPRSAARVRSRSVTPRWLSRLPYAFVLCGVGAGLAVVATNHFRRGSMLMAAAVFIGALARLVLPESQVGMLAVRRRWLDVLLMTTAAVGITLVAFVAKGTTG